LGYALSSRPAGMPSRQEELRPSTVAETALSVQTPNHPKSSPENV